MRTAHVVVALALTLSTGCGSTAVPDSGFTDAADSVSADAQSDASDASDAFDAMPSDAPTVDARVPCDAGSAGYPAGPYDFAFGAVLPNLQFTDDSGHPHSLGEYYAPCAESPKLLVIRIAAAWSGPARWHAAHTSMLRTHPDAARLAVLDLLVLGQDDVPATTADLGPWRARYDVAPDLLAIDPAYEFSPLFLGDNRLPLYVFVDSRTMTTLNSLPAPEADALPHQISFILATMDGRPLPAAPPRDLYDNRFSPDQWDMIREMGNVPAAPPDPSNAHADDPSARTWGRMLFNDTGLSPSGSFSCSGCHKLGSGYADGLPTAMGVAQGSRNTPSIAYAAHSPWIFWDGRVDSLWAQALGPVENPIEMNSSRLFIAHYLAANYSTQYTAIFGPLPDLSDATRFPPSGRPGDPAWEGMTAADQATVNRVFTNMGKAIEAYERTVTLGATPLDGYAAGDVNALTPQARDGLQHWFRYGCAQCHYGPRLTDDSFHNIHMPTGSATGVPDRGRIDAIPQLLATVFASDGPFSDAPASPSHLAGLTQQDIMLGQFRTPTLRGGAATGPWGHGGTFTTLDSVVLHYARSAEHRVIDGTIGPVDIHLNGFHQDTTTLGSIADVVRAATPN